MNQVLDPLDYQITRALSEQDEEYVWLLKADRHRWGTGQIHQIDLDSDLTLCGQSPARCPGTKFSGSATRITCKLCLRSLETRAAAAEREAEIARRQQEWAEGQRQWWELYNAYLRSPVWLNKRRRVLQRCNGWCEGCGERRAIQVHHLCYPRGCLPGSAQWIAQEKLWDLKVQKRPRRRYGLDGPRADQAATHAACDPPSG